IFPYDRAALWNYYTFSRGPTKGLSLGLGASWQGRKTRGIGGASWRVNPADPNSLILKNGEFTVVGASVRYTTKINGYETNFNLTVSNLTDLEDQGGGAWIEPRNTRLTTTIRF
ncbi:MAG: hypothetical protein ACREH8_20625, partial [Opitutaceae bacterium]